MTGADSARKINAWMMKLPPAFHRASLGRPAARRLSRARTAGLVDASGDDDDAFCRANNVKVGSPEYVACRKDRDVQRANAAARADHKQRDLGEYMLNNPVRP